MKRTILAVGLLLGSLAAATPALASHDDGVAMADAANTVPSPVDGYLWGRSNRPEPNPYDTRPMADSRVIYTVEIVPNSISDWYALSDEAKRDYLGSVVSAMTLANPGGHSYRAEVDRRDRVTGSHSYDYAMYRPVTDGWSIYIAPGAQEQG